MPGEARGAGGDRPRPARSDDHGRRPDGDADDTGGSLGESIAERVLRDLATLTAEIRAYRDELSTYQATIDACMQIVRSHRRRLTSLERTLMHDGHDPLTPIFRRRPPEGDGDG